MPQKLDESADEDHTPIFDVLIGNEFEFTSLLMEPKANLRDKVKQIFGEVSPTAVSNKITLLSLLQKSKSSYELESTKAKDENFKLRMQLEQYQKKMYELAMNNIPIRDNIESFLRSMGCDESMLHMQDSRVSQVIPNVVRRKGIELGD